MAMFEQFRSVDKADLGSSRSLENHALLVMNALDEAIANMDDADYLIDMLLTTGKSHRRFDNFSASIFLVHREDTIVNLTHFLNYTDCSRAPLREHLLSRIGGIPASATRVLPSGVQEEWAVSR